MRRRNLTYSIKTEFSDPSHISIALPRDDAGTAKFEDADNIDYPRKFRELWIWARDIKRRREKARPETSSASPGLPSEQPHFLRWSWSADRATANYFQGSMNNVGQIIHGSSIGIYKQVQ